MIGPGIGSWPARRARMNPASVALSTEQEELSYEHYLRLVRRGFIVDPHAPAPRTGGRTTD